MISLLTTNLTTEQRNTVLAAHGGMAIKWDELIALGKQAGRERVRDANIVYIYHGRIDMLGDKRHQKAKHLKLSTILYVN